jgi:hypothetical protein
MIPDPMTNNFGAIVKIATLVLNCAKTTGDVQNWVEQEYL